MRSRELHNGRLTVYFTGDTHFGASRVLRSDHRPFATLDAHDLALVERWNAVVGPDDVVRHLGDRWARPPARVAEIARSGVPAVVAVSCAPGTFARDAATVVAGGYALESVTPIDQFRYSAHVEIVGVFRRPVAKRKRRLLS